MGIDPNGLIWTAKFNLKKMVYFMKWFIQNILMKNKFLVFDYTVKNKLEHNLLIFY